MNIPDECYSRNTWCVLNIYQHFYSEHNYNICFIISQEQEMLEQQKDIKYYKEA
jgi:hypothetical protein